MWVPVDLRDGNQALAEPMDPDRKHVLFSLLVDMGFKEIEIGYPSASQADFEFARRLSRDPHLPDDVTISAFTPARAELIDRTFEAMAGVRKGLVHLCAPTAPTWRSVVLGASRDDVLAMIVEAADRVSRHAEAAGSSRFRFEFSPEVFNLTEPDYVLEVCDTLTERWDASPDRPVVHNLPATVEIAMPNVYADQIEYMHRNLARRDAVILSVHPHNDRGTGVAAAELAVLAGAQRVEGCLFGNGERTGNVDLVTLALNAFSQGIDPMIDLSAIDEVRRTVEYCTRLPVHPRHPYAGDLVYTAFSGTHQDAIRKGFARMTAVTDAGTPPAWDVPYLPVDPGDVGRTYEAVIRLNSQSGKGGVAYVLEARHGVRLPRPVQVEFSAIVQSALDASGKELGADEVWELFTAEYARSAGIEISGVRQERRAGECVISAVAAPAGHQVNIRGRGSDLAAAAADLLGHVGLSADVLSLETTALGARTALGAHVCLAETGADGASGWGAGFGETEAEAAVRAVISATVRLGALTTRG